MKAGTRSRRLNGLQRLQQWPCYLQWPEFESQWRPVEFFACNKGSSLNNQTPSLKSMPCFQSSIRGVFKAPNQKKVAGRYRRTVCETVVILITTQTFILLYAWSKLKLLRYLSFYMQLESQVHVTLDMILVTILTVCSDCRWLFR